MDSSALGIIRYTGKHIQPIGCLQGQYLLRNLSKGLETVASTTICSHKWIHGCIIASTSRLPMSPFLIATLACQSSKLEGKASQPGFPSEKQFDLTE